MHSTRFVGGISEKSRSTLTQTGEIRTEGTLFITARLHSEWYEFVDDLDGFLGQMRSRGVRADLFSFLLRIPERSPKYNYYHEMANLAVLPVATYDNWWKNQINDKTRNMVRKAYKKGVTVQIAEFDDRFLQGIKAIYDECPIRQGRPFRHYAKDLETLKREHATFLEQSEFIGAYCAGELIGFVKLVYLGGWASMMQIIAKIGEREKAPTNALIAKAVERCAENGVPLLHYGIWGRGSIRDFKSHHGFQCYEVPRYYVPLNAKGRLMLCLGLHKSAAERLPENWLDRISLLRARWYSFKYRRKMDCRGSSSIGRASRLNREDGSSKLPCSTSVPKNAGVSSQPMH